GGPKTENGACSFLFPSPPLRGAPADSRFPTHRRFRSGPGKGRSREPPAVHGGGGGPLRVAQPHPRGRRNRGRPRGDELARATAARGPVFVPPPRTPSR